MALRAMGLLVAFWLAVVLVVGGFVAAEAVLCVAMSPASLALLVVAPGLATLVTALCSRAGPTPTIRLTPASTRLWELVHSAADDVGVEAPTSVQLDAGVAVRLASRRRLVIGVPLLAAVNPGQLSVLVRRALSEDVRFRPAIAWGVRFLSRTRDTLARTPRWNAPARPAVRAFTAYYLRVAEQALTTSDSAEVRWEREVIEELWELFLVRYAALGLRAGFLPARPMAGFRRLLDAELPLGDEARASALLAEGETLDHAFAQLLSEEQRAMPRADWDTLADLSQRHEVTRSALEVLGGLTLGAALDRLAAGELAFLAKPGATDVVASVRYRLALVVTAALADVGVVRWRMAWPGPPELVVDDPGAEAITTALDEAAALTPEVLPLRMLLVVSGVPPDFRPVRQLSSPR
ncbi:hypothetical protein AB0383_11495 [Amycolatopsis sp. NPDC051373]|uniref:hypothetical protein n=1 Tax=Amycolatopsis sp. NPDC051373 TaxID=3155801 RepID=UPI00344BB278